MADLRLIRASDGTGNASMATVQATRSPLATTIIVDTVNHLPTHFVASMGTPHTFTDPITSEVITVISEATCVDFVGHLDSGSIEIDSIAPGYTDLGSAVGDVVVLRPTTLWSDNLADTMAVSHNDDGTLKDEIVTEDKYADDSIPTDAYKDGSIPAVKTAFGGNYSTSEVNTGFKWVDGKDIYKKTIDFGALANNSTKTVLHGVDNMDRLISIDAYCYSETGLTYSGGSSFGTAGTNFFSFYRSGSSLDSISGVTNGDRSALSAYVTIYYTKT